VTSFQTNSVKVKKSQKCSRNVSKDHARDGSGLCQNGQGVKEAARVVLRLDKPYVAAKMARYLLMTCVISTAVQKYSVHVLKMKNVKSDQNGTTLNGESAQQDVEVVFK